MNASASRRLAWALCALTIGLATARLTLAIVDPASSDSSSGPSVPGGGVPVAAFEALVLVMLAIIGAVVASRQPHNPIGWIFGVISLSLGLLILSAPVTTPCRSMFPNRAGTPCSSRGWPAGSGSQP